MQNINVNLYHSIMDCIVFYVACQFSELRDVLEVTQVLLLDIFLTN